MFNIVSRGVRNIHGKIYSPLTRCGAHFLVTSYGNHRFRVSDLVYYNALLVKFLKIN